MIDRLDDIGSFSSTTLVIPVTHNGFRQTETKTFVTGNSELLTGQKNTPKASGTAGMKADPTCSLQAIAPVSMTTRFAINPIKIPKA